jgi:hypothetical protein
MLQFGNIALAKEDTRAVWTRLWLERLRQDIRFAVRMLRRNPGFSAVTLIVLAMGIGATTAMFSIVNSVLFRPLPFREPDRLVSLAMAGALRAAVGRGEKNAAISRVAPLEQQLRTYLTQRRFQTGDVILLRA